MKEMLMILVIKIRNYMLACEIEGKLQIHLMHGPHFDLSSPKGYMGYQNKGLIKIIF